jgi:hypothetical protein
MHHHHYNDFRDKQNANSSEEDCFVLPSQKIFYFNEDMKDVLNEMLESTGYSLENFDDLDINSFRLKDNEQIVK